MLEIWQFDWCDNILQWAMHEKVTTFTKHPSPLSGARKTNLPEAWNLWRNISAKIRVYTYLYLGGTLFVNWYRK